MEDLYKFISEASATVLIIAAFAYFLKRFIEKKLDGFAERSEKRFESIVDASIDIKTALRHEERKHIVELRAAMEEWEFFLQSLLTRFSNMQASDADINKILEEENDHFRKVRLQVVRIAAYVRDWEFENQILEAIQKIRTTYSPLIFELIPEIIDVHAELMPIQQRMNAISEGKMDGITLDQTKLDQKNHTRLMKALTDVNQRFSDSLVGKYQVVANELVDLKLAINNYVYRPITSTSLEED